MNYTRLRLKKLTLKSLLFWIDNRWKIFILEYAFIFINLIFRAIFLELNDLYIIPLITLVVYPLVFPMQKLNIIYGRWLTKDFGTPRDTNKKFMEEWNRNLWIYHLLVFSWYITLPLFLYEWLKINRSIVTPELVYSTLYLGILPFIISKSKRNKIEEELRKNNKITNKNMNGVQDI